MFIAVVVAGWQIALWFEGSDADSPARSADPAQATEPQAPIEAIEDGVPAPQTAADYALRAGEIMTIRAAELPPDRPVILGLVLPVPSTKGG